MANDDALSFAKDIRSMFTDMDVAHMKPKGIDLSSKADVEKHAEAIYTTVTEGSMPPPGSGETRWSAEMCDRFKRWQNQGCLP
jgi:hypothetical protein